MLRCANCRGNARLPNLVGRQICKKVVTQLADPLRIAGGDISALCPGRRRPDFAMAKNSDIIP